MERTWPDESYYELLSQYEKLIQYLKEKITEIGDYSDEWEASIDLFLEYCFVNIALEKSCINEQEKYIMSNLPGNLEEVKDLIPGFSSFIRRLSVERYEEKGAEMFPDETMRIFVDKMTKVNLVHPTSDEGNPYLENVINLISDILDRFITYGRRHSNWKQSHFMEFFGENIEQVKLERRWELEEKKKELESESSKGDTEDKEHILAACLEELNGLIGLEEVKEEIKGLVTTAKLSRIREQQGLAVRKRESYHLVFAGNPGTGKTTVARIVSGIYYALGVLPENKLIETGRSDLVGEFIGQTAPKTEAAIQEARGGVLFIDEAYSLSDSASDKDFGKEAIDTLVQYMENYRDELVVVVAGYKEKMEHFLEANEGLRSRFSRVISFANYNADELEQILDLYLKDGEYILEPDARTEFKRFFKNDIDTQSDSFANARTVRKFVDGLCAAQDKRIAMQISAIDESEMKIFLQTITFADIKAAEATLDKVKTANRVGFFN